MYWQVTKSLVLLAVLAAVCLASTAAGHGNNPKVIWNDVELDDQTIVLFELFDALGYEWASPLQECAEVAVLTCGAGSVCCVRVAGGGGAQSCSFCCRDGNEECDHCQICDQPASDP